MIFSLSAVLGVVKVMWVAYVAVLITVCGAFIRKQYCARQEVEVVSVLIERTLHCKEIHGRVTFNTLAQFTSRIESSGLFQSSSQSSRRA
jgi:hypothetical protein